MQYVDKQLEGGHARMLAVRLPSCASVALPPGSQGAAGDGLMPELQAAYVLLWLTWTVSPRMLVSRVRFGAVLEAREVLGRQTPNVEQAPTDKHETLDVHILHSTEQTGGAPHSPRLLHQL